MLSTKWALIGRWLRFDRLLAGALVWLIATIAASLAHPALSTVELSLALAGLFVVVGLFRLDRWLIGLAVVACLAVAWVNWLGLDRLSVPVSRPVELSGVVVELPQIGDRSTRLTIQVEQSARSTLVHHRVTLDVDAAPLTLAGSVVQATAQPLAVSANTARLDPVRGLVAHLTSGSFVVVGPDRSVSGALLRLRARIVDRATQLWQDPAASLAAGLVVGNRANFDPTLAAAMQITGTTHLVAVSGENLVVVMVILQLLVPRRPAWLRFGFLAVGLIGFGVLSGGTASVVRAVALATAILAAKEVGRPVNGLRLLVLVATGMVIANPFLPAFDLGFQLSFVAVASLVTLGSWLLDQLPGPINLRGPIALTFAAYLSTLPILAGSFGLVGLSSPVVNLVVQPLTFAAMVAAGATFLVGFIWQPFAHLFAWLSWPLLAAITGLIQWFARQSIPVLALAPPVWLTWVATALLILIPAWSMMDVPGVESTSE